MYSCTSIFSWSWFANEEIYHSGVKDPKIICIWKVTRTALSSFAPASAPHFSVSFLTSFPLPGSSPLILDEARETSPISKKQLESSAFVSFWRGSRTLELLLGNLGAPACGVEVVAHATSSSDTEVEREPGLWLSHCGAGEMWKIGVEGRLSE